MPETQRHVGDPSDKALSPPPGVERGVVLAGHTSIRVGGPARFFSQPESVDVLRTQISWAEMCGLRVFILGGGTNVIFTDAGFDGLVVCTDKLCNIRIDGSALIAEAGVPLQVIVCTAGVHGLSGMEWAVGIPGTVGGAVAMNAGAFGGDIASALDRAEARLGDGQLVWLPASALELGYRTSALHDRLSDTTILTARFQLKESTAEACERAVAANRSLRTDKLPQGATAGCVFRNPTKGPTAGELLDRAGCKGMHEGLAHVSELHANFIINEGQSNARDILRLMERMAQRVWKTQHQHLQPEVILP